MNKACAKNERQAASKHNASMLENMRQTIRMIQLIFFTFITTGVLDPSRARQSLPLGLNNHTAYKFSLVRRQLRRLAL
jgi:hypothetical protein